MQAAKPLARDTEADQTDAPNGRQASHGELIFRDPRFLIYILRSYLAVDLPVCILERSGCPIVTSANTAGTGRRIDMRLGS